MPANDAEDNLEHWLRVEVLEAARQLDTGIFTSLTVDEVRQHFIERRAQAERDSG